MTPADVNVSSKGSFELGRVILADGTYDVIKAMVLDHRIPAGARVGIDALSRELNVSQTPVREALARLEADGLVVKVPLKGYETTKLLTLEEFLELFRFRAILEPWSAAEAAKIATDDQVRALIAEVERGERLQMSRGSTVDFPAFIEHDANFHRLLSEVAGNTYVQDALVRSRVHLHLLRAYLASQDESSVLARALFTEAYSGEGQSGSVREHRGIVEAIRSRDADLAKELMTRHIEGSRERLSAAVEAVQ